MKILNKPLTWTDSLDKRPKRKKIDMLNKLQTIIIYLFIYPVFLKRIYKTAQACLHCKDCELKSI
jgi:hypothetical protein